MANQNLQGGRAYYTGKNAYASQAFELDVRRQIQALQNELTTLQNAVSSALASIASDGTLISASASDGTITGWATGTPRNIISLVLPAGTWLVFGDGFFGGGAITGTDVLFQISPTSATFVANGGGQSESSFEGPTTPTTSSNIRAGLAPRYMVSTAATPLTAFLVGRIIFTTGTPTAGGTLRALRVRL